VHDLWAARRTIDVVTLADQLQKNSTLDLIGGTDYLYDVSSFLLSTSTCAEYARIVKEKAVLRNILKVSQSIIGDVFEQKDTINILDQIEKRIFDLTQIRSSDSIKHIKDILSTRIEDYMAIVDNPELAHGRKVYANYK
jgi:replicative DNA helicase